MHMSIRQLNCNAHVNKTTELHCTHQQDNSTVMHMTEYEIKSTLSTNTFCKTFELLHSLLNFQLQCDRDLGLSEGKKLIILLYNN